MWKPGCIFDYIVGACAHVELKFRRNFPCLLVVPAVCFGIARDPCRASQGLCNVLTTIQSFCNITRQSAFLNLEILYGRTLIESNSYHHHHHNGHEICFVLLCNTREHKICSWSEIIELVRFKLKECYIKFSLRHCHKISSHDAPSRGCSFLYAE